MEEVSHHSIPLAELLQTQQIYFSHYKFLWLHESWTNTSMRVSEVGESRFGCRYWEHMGKHVPSKSWKGSESFWNIRFKKSTLERPSWLLSLDMIVLPPQGLVLAMDEKFWFPYGNVADHTGRNLTSLKYSLLVLLPNSCWNRKPLPPSSHPVVLNSCLPASWNGWEGKSQMETDD